MIKKMKIHLILSNIVTNNINEMLSIYEDVIMKISEYLFNHQKIALTSTSKIMEKFKHKFIYRDRTEIHVIVDLSYFDRFESIEIYDPIHEYPKIDKSPKCAKRIYYAAHTTDIPQSVTHLSFAYKFDRSLNNCIPSSVINLKFTKKFNQSIKGCIPSKVTYLKFSNKLNQPIKDCIPSSVTRLTFGRDFNQSIEGCIPSSVTELIFGNRFNQPIIGNIPIGVTFLSFGEDFNQPIKDNIPESVTYLRLIGKFNQPIDDIPISVKHLTLDRFYKGKINMNISVKIDYW